MDFFKRAWLSLSAKKGRSLLMLLVMSAIMLFVFAGLLIHSAADKATKQAKENVGATLTLSANREAAFKKMDRSSSSKPTLKTTPVKLSDAKKIAKLKNVKNYNVTSSASVNASSFSAISTSSSSSQSMPGGGSSSSSGDISISGVSNLSSASSFTNDTNKLTSGRYLTTKDEGTNNTVVEKQLAKKNNLKVGDTMTVKSTSGSKSYKLKIVGIYTASSSSTSTQAGPNTSDPANTVFTSYTLANTIKGSKYANTADSVTYTISNPSAVKSVKKAGTKLISTSKYSLVTNDSNYQMVKSSMASIKSFADKIVWLVAIAGTIILALIIILQVRERQHEIGVLLALGESRVKVIGQFFVELGLVMVVSLVIAAAGGKFVGDKLGSQLMSTSNSASAASIQGPGDKGTQSNGGGMSVGGQSGSKPSGMGGGNQAIGGSSQTQTTDLNVSLSAVQLAELGGMGLAITFLSVLIGAGSIVRLQPKKILIE